ncbi:hypothetical protein AB2J22_20835 [Aeromonas sp. A5]|uniref:hypothetical protein n=1 Tax=unclassified Aeromonas TaxID=257493 RepID=UPI00376F594E
MMMNLPKDHVPRQLTPEEIEDLRQDNHRRHEANMKALESMDLSHLMPEEQPAPDKSAK